MENEKMKKEKTNKNKCIAILKFKGISEPFALILRARVSQINLWQEMILDYLKDNKIPQKNCKCICIQDYWECV
jgi:hypothetical protein